jgi:methylenetetrahydrofolate dehydrogenase (NADP+)/methenyltetrahydrofolate cyclohydrolase
MRASQTEPSDSVILKPSDGVASLIDGRAVSEDILVHIAAETREAAGSGLTPGLAVVLVGADPASQVYVKSKSRAAQACGFHSVQHDLPDTTSEAELLRLIEALNADPQIHGILVQLPLPPGIDAGRILNAVTPAKDVDGFHPVNAGLLAVGDQARALVPCTPAGCMVLIERAAAALGRSIAGADALIVGRSNIVGKPMAHLLLGADATVTIAHSRSRDLPALVRGADILVAAVGRPEMIEGEWIKPCAIVIDVGINRVPGQGLDAAGRPATRLVGDVARAGALMRAAAITPVPGGVGPMTIAMLMSNTLRAARLASA